MGRLTKRYEDGSLYVPMFRDKVVEFIEKLAHYEDLEEQGRLICLPCKIGDIVYVADKTGRRVHPFTIDIIEMNKFDKSILASYIGKEQNLQYWKIRISIERFEEHFCKTKEEAEAKLEELKGGGTDD